MNIQHDVHISFAADTPVSAYMDAAKRKGLCTVGFAAPVWDTAVSPAINAFYAARDVSALKALPLPDGEGIRILRGCEAELDKNGTLGLGAAAAKSLDFVLVSHAHSEYDEVIDSTLRRNPKKLAALLCERFAMLTEHPLGVYITAISCPFYPTGNPDNFDDVLFYIDDSTLENLFADAAYHDMALEINASAFLSYAPASMHRSELFRIYETARDCGCRFVFGTGCSSPDMYDALLARLKTLATLLELSEKHICPIL